jgi:hypothetical protein
MLFGGGVVKDVFLHSLRWSPAWGLRWNLERDCKVATSEQWLEVFRKDEGGVIFKLHDNPRPRVLKADKDEYFERRNPRREVAL